MEFGIGSMSPTMRWNGGMPRRYGLLMGIRGGTSGVSVGSLVTDFARFGQGSGIGQVGSLMTGSTPHLQFLIWKQRLVAVMTVAEVGQLRSVTLPCGNEPSRWGIRNLRL